jgi:hypothetical protein
MRIIMAGSNASQNTIQRNSGIKRTRTRMTLILMATKLTVAFEELCDYQSMHVLGGHMLYKRSAKLELLASTLPRCASLPKESALIKPMQSLRYSSPSPSSAPLPCQTYPQLDRSIHVRNRAHSR